jgi:hypothetical protein
LFRDLLDVLVEGSERSLRFRLEGRSSPKGAQPKWLRPAADFSLLRTPTLGASSAVIEAHPLVETMPERFQQGDLFADLDPRRSPIDLFEDALEDALRGDTDSDRFDESLVATFKRFEGLLEQGVEKVELVNGRTVRVDSASLENVRALARNSYAPQRVKVAGRLRRDSLQRLPLRPHARQSNGDSGNRARLGAREAQESFWTDGSDHRDRFLPSIGQAAARRGRAH